MFIFQPSCFALGFASGYHFFRQIDREAWFHLQRHNRRTAKDEASGNRHSA